MSRLVVLVLDSQTGAQQRRQVLARLRKQQLVSLAEPVVVTRGLDGKLRIKSTAGLAGAMALLGAFWGVMVGLLFSTPWLGLGIGAAAGAILGVLADVGTEEKSIQEAGHTLEPGQSALLLLAHDWADDRVLETEISRFEGVSQATPEGYSGPPEGYSGPPEGYSGPPERYSGPRLASTDWRVARPER